MQDIPEVKELEKAKSVKSVGSIVNQEEMSEFSFNGGVATINQV